MTVVVKLVAIVVMLNLNLTIAQGVAKDANQFETAWRMKQVLRDKLNTNERANPIKFSDIKGSPFLNKEFVDGEFFYDGKSEGHFYLRYNIYSDQIEILTNPSFENLNSDKPVFEAFLKDNNSKVILDGRTIKSYDYNDFNKQTLNNYFIEVNKPNKFTLLLKKRCVLTSAEKAPTPNHADRAAKFTIYNDYYILDQKEKYPQKIELNKRSIFKAFPEYSDALKNFIKEEGITIREETDVVKLINYMNTL